MTQSGTRTRSIPDTVMVMLKYPEWGLVKTRLAIDVGEYEALLIYKRLLAYTLDIVSTVDDVRVNIFFDGKDPTSFPSGTYSDEWSLHPQVGEDLGERLKNAFSTVFAEGPRRAVVIGTDCIGLTSGIMAEALGSLDHNDITIGPTKDGGYYLIGMKAGHDIFTGIPWSTPQVYKKSIERIEALGLKARVLPTLYDVDTLEDWKRAVKDEPGLMGLERLFLEGAGP